MKTSKRDEMETLVHCVMNTHHSHKLDHSSFERQLLPRATEVLGPVHHSDPVNRVQGDLDKV